MVCAILHLLGKSLFLEHSHRGQGSIGRLLSHLVYKPLHPTLVDLTQTWCVWAGARLICPKPLNLPRFSKNCRVLVGPNESQEELISQHKITKLHDFRFDSLNFESWYWRIYWLRTFVHFGSWTIIPCHGPWQFWILMDCNMMVDHDFMIYLVMFAYHFGIIFNVTMIVWYTWVIFVLYST